MRSIYHKLTKAVVAALLAVVLGGCPGDILARLDNPRDPQAPSYQGYYTLTDVNEVGAHSPEEDGAISWIPEFIISEVLGADAYRLQISTSADFENVLYEGDGFSTNIMPLASLEDGGSYYWRGAAHKDGVWGKWTDARDLLYQRGSITGMIPEDGNTTVDTTPTLSWDAVGEAARYEVQLADNEAGVAVASVATVTEAEYTPLGALGNNHVHFWRVRAVDGEGQTGEWSTTYSLAVNFGTMTSLSPSDGGTTTDTTPTLSWDAVVGAARYKVQIAGSEAGVENAGAVPVTASAHEYTWPTDLGVGDKFYWRVRALDSAGQSGAWSSIISLSIRDYIIGDPGPAGGIIFYDKGSYSHGWRYLEAAKSDQGTSIEWGG